MTDREFCFWMQGLLELQPDLKTLNEDQVVMIRQHLGYVFKPAPMIAESPLEKSAREAMRESGLKVSPDLKFC